MWSLGAAECRSRESKMGLHVVSTEIYCTNVFRLVVYDTVRSGILVVTSDHGRLTESDRTVGVDRWSG